MKAKEYLGQIRELDIKIRQKSEELDTLYGRAVNPGGFDYSRGHVQTSPSDGRTERLLVRCISLNEKIGAEIADLAAMKHRIVNQIQALKNRRHIIILFERYVKLKGLGEIAEEMGYSYQYTVELHGRALKEFSELYAGMLEGGGMSP